MLDTFKPAYIAPPVVYLTSEACKETGALVEVNAGWVAKYRWIRSAGVAVCLFHTHLLLSIRESSYPTKPLQLPKSLEINGHRLSSLMKRLLIHLQVPRACLL